MKSINQQTQKIVNFFSKGLKVKAHPHLANFCLFCKNICHQFRFTSADDNFFLNKILSSLNTNLQRCRRPASEQDKILSSVKSDEFVNSHELDLKENVNKVNLITLSGTGMYYPTVN